MSDGRERRGLHFVEYVGIAIWLLLVSWVFIAPFVIR